MWKNPVQPVGGSGDRTILQSSTGVVSGTASIQVWFPRIARRHLPNSGQKGKERVRSPGFILGKAWGCIEGAAYGMNFLEIHNANLPLSCVLFLPVAS